MLMEELAHYACAVQPPIRHSTGSPAEWTPMQPEEDKSRRGIRQRYFAQFSGYLEFGDWYPC
jgi:hypothetical protein